jgi:DNA replication protein DnaC
VAVSAQDGTGDPGAIGQIVEVSTTRAQVRLSRTVYVLAARERCWAAEQARDASWTQEEYLAAVLSREFAAREASGAAIRIRSAGFPTRKSLADRNFDHQPALNPDMIAHLVPARSWPTPAT